MINFCFTEVMICALVHAVSYRRKSTHRTSQGSHHMGKQLQVKMNNTRGLNYFTYSISALILVGAHSKSFTFDAFHLGLHCLLRFKKNSGMEIHNLENSTCDP